MAELADRQHGVVSARQLRALGYSYDVIADAAAAGRLPRRRLDRVLERSEELGRFDLAAVEDLLARVARHLGVVPLRDALALYRPNSAFIRSGVESRFLSLVESAGMPAPAMNCNVAGLELDAYWEPERFAVELDVFETHGTRAAFARDRLRQEDLLLAGIEVDRITGDRLEREPRRVMERLARLLAQRQELLRPPRGGGR